MCVKINTRWTHIGAKSRAKNCNPIHCRLGCTLGSNCSVRLLQSHHYKNESICVARELCTSATIRSTFQSVVRRWRKLLEDKRTNYAFDEAARTAPYLFRKSRRCLVRRVHAILYSATQCDSVLLSNYVHMQWSFYYILNKTAEQKAITMCKYKTDT